MNNIKRKFLINKARINKRNNTQAAYHIKAYVDRIIDDMVENQGNNEYTIPTTLEMYGALEQLNKPVVYNNYKALLDSPYIRNDSVQELLIQNKANRDLANIVEAELNQMKNNLDYIQRVIDKYNIPSKEYRKVITNEGALANRKKIIEAVNKEISVANNIPAGINIPSIQPYRDLDFVSENLLRQNRMSSEYSMFEEENRLAEEQGRDTPHQMKIWNWLGIGKTTRHESNDGQTVPFNEPFLIVNDATGEEDEMMYPCDPEGSPGNSYVCYCELEVH